MKRPLTYLMAAALLMSLGSCATMGRTMQSLGRTFTGGGTAPVVR